MTAHSLARLLRPRSIALIGASSVPGSVGQVLLANLLEGGFKGPIFAVNHDWVMRSGATGIAELLNVRLLAFD